MNLGVVGTRTYNDHEQMLRCIKNFCSCIGGKPDVIVSGGALGADALAKSIASEHLKCEYKEFLPDWNKYGKGAGPKRNEQIVEESDAVIAFWDGTSAGTRSTINLCYETKTPILVICY